MGDTAETLSTTREVESASAQTPHSALSPEGGALEELAIRRVAAKGGLGSLLRGANPVMRSPSASGIRAVAMRRAQTQVGNRALASQLRRSPAVIQRQCSCGGTCAACSQNASATAESAEPQPTALQQDAPVVHRRAIGDGPVEVDASVVPSAS